MSKRIYVGLTLLLLAFSVQLVSADEYLDEAKRYLAEGKTKAAVIQLKNALQDDPANGEARLLLGTIYLQVGDGASAEKELRRAAKTGVAKHRWRSALGKAYQLQGKHQAILDELQLDPTDPGPEQAALLSLRGQALLTTRRLDLARVEFEQALVVQPGYPDAELGLAKVMFASGDKENAAKLLDAMLANHPTHIEGLIVRAELSRLARRLKPALADYEQVLKLDADNIKALMGRAAVNLQQNQHEAAEKDLALLDERLPNNPLVAYLQGVAAFQQRDFDRAEELIHRVLQVSPNHPQSQLIYGALMFAKGDMEQADEYLGLARKQMPNHLPSLKLMVAARLKSGRQSQARDLLETAVARYPDDPQLLAMLGNVYLQTGRYQEGSELLSRAVEINPDLAALRTQLAFGLLAQGNTSGAIDELQSAVDMGQDLIQADVLLVLSHLRNKEVDAALRAGEALELRMPDNPVAYNLTGLALLAAGRGEEARARFEKALAIDPSFATARVNLARLEVGRKDFAAAEQQFHQILVRQPGNLEALLGLAGLAQQRGDRVQMYQWLDQAYTQNPKSTKPGVLITQAYLRDGENLKALRIANELASSFPDRAEVLKVLGTTQLAAGESNSAARSMQQLVEKQRTPENLLLLARAQKAINDANGMRRSLRQALELRPSYQQASTALASLELTEGNFEAAKTIGRSLQQTAPKRAVGFEIEGVALLQEKRLPEAASLLEQGYALQPSRELAIRLARVYTMLDDRAQAIDKLDDWLRRQPEDATSRAYYGMLLQEQGRKEEAIAAYRLAANGVPDNVMVLNNLAWLLQEKGDPQALEIAERVYRLAPKRPEVLDTYGWILANSGGVERGVEVLRQAAAFAPGNAEILYHLGFALRQAGREDEGNKQLRRLVRDHPSDPMAQQAQALLDE